MNRFALAVVCLAVAAPMALAQSFEPRVGMRTDHLNSGTPQFLSGSEIFFDPMPAPLPLQLLFGPFNAEGFFNRGMFNFLGSITVDDPLGAATIAPLTPVALRQPYNFGNIVQTPTPQTITFDANRGPGFVDAPWAFGQPPPIGTYTYPVLGGAPDAYFPGLRFVFNPGTLQARIITFTVTGIMQAVSDWWLLAEEPPEGPTLPGFQQLMPSAFVTEQVSATFIIFPAPGTAVLFGLGGLLATRRRRGVA